MMIINEIDRQVPNGILFNFLFPDLILLYTMQHIPKIEDINRQKKESISPSHPPIKKISSTSPKPSILTFFLKRLTNRVHINKQDVIENDPMNI